MHSGINFTCKYIFINCNIMIDQDVLTITDFKETLAIFISDNIRNTISIT